MTSRLEVTITGEHDRRHAYGEMPEPRAPHVREYPALRWILRPLCWITGHRTAWIKPLVPNPYANESWVLGCSRCGAVDRRKRT